MAGPWSQTGTPNPWMRPDSGPPAVPSAAPAPLALPAYDDRTLPPDIKWMMMPDEELRKAALNSPGAAAEWKGRVERKAAKEKLSLGRKQAPAPGYYFPPIDQDMPPAGAYEEGPMSPAAMGGGAPPTLGAPSLFDGPLPAPDGFAGGGGIFDAGAPQPPPLPPADPRAAPRPVPPPMLAAPPAGPPNAVPPPLPGDFSGGMQAMTDPRAMPDPRRPPASMGAGFMADAPAIPSRTNPPPTSPSAFEAFSSDPEKMEMLRDFGLRMMMAGQAQPGSVVGPSLMGALGRSGMATFEDKRGRDAMAAKAEAAAARGVVEQSRHEDKMAIEERKIDSTAALRRETMKLREEGQQTANKISLMRADTDRASLELEISADESKALEKALEDPLISTDEEAKAKITKSIYAMHDRIRVSNGFPAQHKDDAANLGSDPLGLR